MNVSTDFRIQRLPNNGSETAAQKRPNGCRRISRFAKRISKLICDLTDEGKISYSHKFYGPNRDKRLGYLRNFHKCNAHLGAYLCSQIYRLTNNSWETLAKGLRDGSHLSPVPKARIPGSFPDIESSKRIRKRRPKKKSKSVNLIPETFPDYPIPGRFISDDKYLYILEQERVQELAREKERQELRRIQSEMDWEDIPSKLGDEYDRRKRRRGSVDFSAGKGKQPFEKDPDSWIKYFKNISLKKPEEFFKFTGINLGKFTPFKSEIIDITDEEKQVVSERSLIWDVVPSLSAMGIDISYFKLPHFIGSERVCPKCGPQYLWLPSNKEYWKCGKCHRVRYMDRADKRIAEATFR